MEQWISERDPTGRGFWFRNVETGLLHGTIRWPHGRTPAPSGCRWCGTGEREHGFGPTWLRGRGFHQHERPTDAQILARMKARRNAFKSRCRCRHPWLRVNPWRCEADRCEMHDELLRGWLTPMSGDEAAALFTTETTGGSR